MTSDDLCQENYVFYDPFNRADSGHIKLISEAGPIVLLPVPFTAHHTANYCVEIGEMRPIFRVLQQHDRCSRENAMRLIRSGRRASWRYWTGRATEMHRFEGRYVRQHYFACETAQSLRKPNATAVLALALLMEKQKKFQEAVAHLVSLSQFVDQISVDSILRAWTSLRKLQAEEAALELVQIAIGIHPKNAFLELHVATSLRVLGDYEGAGRHLRSVEENAEGHLLTLQQLSANWELLGNDERAFSASAKTLDIVPDNKDNYVRHAMLCIRFRKISEARLSLERAKDLDSSDQRVKKLLFSLDCEE